MKLKEFARTGRKVSELGMGTYYDPLWIAAAFVGWRKGGASKVEAIKTGLDAGMTLVDTAEIYGSEPLVAEAIRGRKRDEVFLATKVWSNHLHRDELVRSFSRSLRRLGTSYIDLYQVHWPNPSVPISETMAAMEELVVAGKIRYIGVSNFDVRETKAARGALSKSDVVSNQVEYSLRNRYVEANILPYCQKENVSLIAYSPLARGNVLFSRMPKGLLDRYGLTPAQMMLNWVTRSERVLAIPKAANLTHQDENASSVSARLTDAEYDQISNVA